MFDKTVLVKGRDVILFFSNISDYSVLSFTKIETTKIIPRSFYPGCLNSIMYVKNEEHYKNFHDIII